MFMTAGAVFSDSLYEYFGRFYYDAALSCHDIAFSAVEKLAPNHTLFGSDSFYAALDSAKKFVEEIEAYHTGAAYDNIKRENAIKLFFLLLVRLGYDTLQPWYCGPFRTAHSTRLREGLSHMESLYFSNIL